MQIITALQGQRKGKSNVKATIASMEVGDVWETTVNDVSEVYARSVAHKLSNEMDRWYTVSHKVEAYDKITITRVK